ncbi:MAG: tetratricopeptide repeat protein, partial [Thermodesulfobacteriota bacterium]|nr:tetratricopeptide repeat protein [Thermodesulfobacteriota bacterium]
MTPANSPVSNDAENYFQAGVRAQRAGDLDKAAGLYVRSLALAPNDYRAYNNLGIVLLRQDRLGSAAAALARSVNLNPENPVALYYWGKVKRSLGRPVEAEDAFGRALALDPNYVTAHFELGNVLNDQARFDEAILCYDQALALDPNFLDARWPRILALFRKGDLGAAFSDYEARFLREDCKPRELKQPLWDGDELSGKTILLHHEQGLGDTIQFCRYAKLAAARGGRVVLGCQKRLHRLLGSVRGVSQIVVPGDRFRLDCHAPLLSLPRIFKTELDSVPCEVPYLAPPSDARFRLKSNPGSRVNVGLVWAGNPKNTNDSKRSVPLEYFLSLAEVPGLSLHSLQFGERSSDIERLGALALIHDLSEEV